MPKSIQKLVVIGVGNLLLADEGIGIHAVNGLFMETFPSMVKIVDGGTAGIDLVFWLEDADYVIIIDCLEAGAEPGTIFRLPVEEVIFKEKMTNNILSLHEINLKEVLLTARRLGKLPPAVIYGVQPEEVSFNCNLSLPVKKALPRLKEMIKDEIFRKIGMHGNA